MRAGSVGGLDKNVFNVGATPHWARHAIWAVTRTSNGSGPAARSAVQDRKKKRTRTSPSVTQGCVCGAWERNANGGGWACRFVLVPGVNGL